MRGASILAVALSTATTTMILLDTSIVVNAKLADRGRLVKSRNNGRRDKNNMAIEGGAYRGRAGYAYDRDELYQRQLLQEEDEMVNTVVDRQQKKNERVLKKNPLRAVEEKEQQQQKLRGATTNIIEGIDEQQQQQQQTGDVQIYDEPEHFARRLSSQLTGCCYTYKSYSANDMCALYGEDCESGETPSHDSGDESCSQEGLSFIGISFSVNTASGNPYSYQLCDQFPMENIIDRNYDYVMSMDEDGWLVGGGYKSFDYSGKMPYIDSSHTELLRIGSLDTSKG